MGKAKQVRTQYTIKNLTTDMYFASNWKSTGNMWITSEQCKINENMFDTTREAIIGYAEALKMCPKMCVNDDYVMSCIEPYII